MTTQRFSRAPSARCMAQACALAFSLWTATTPAENSALPSVHEQSGIAYLSGGIGVAEADAMKAEFGHYSLNLTLATRTAGRRDAYLASVPVVIRDAQGKVLLDVVTDGPYLLIDLPAGTYRVTAQFDQQEKQATVRIAQGARERVALVWPAKPGDASEDRKIADFAVAELQARVPPVNTVLGIPYLSGGIGEQESKAIESVSSRYSLALTFASREQNRAAYLADVPVTITDTRGSTVLEAVTDGPFLLIDLPPGDYRVSAAFKDQVKQSTARIIAGGHAKLSFIWDTP